MNNFFFENGRDIFDTRMILHQNSFWDMFTSIKQLDYYQALFKDSENTQIKKVKQMKIIMQKYIVLKNFVLI